MQYFETDVARLVFLHIPVAVTHLLLGVHAHEHRMPALVGYDVVQKCLLSDQLIVPTKKIPREVFLGAFSVDLHVVPARVAVHEYLGTPHTHVAPVRNDLPRETEIVILPAVKGRHEHPRMSV